MEKDAENSNISSDPSTSFANHLSGENAAPELELLNPNHPSSTESGMETIDIVNFRPDTVPRSWSSSPQQLQLPEETQNWDQVLTLARKLEPRITQIHPVLGYGLHKDVDDTSSRTIVFWGEFEVPPAGHPDALLHEGAGVRLVEDMSVDVWSPMPLEYFKSSFQADRLFCPRLCGYVVPSTGEEKVVQRVGIPLFE